MAWNPISTVPDGVIMGSHGAFALSPDGVGAVANPHPCKYEDKGDKARYDYAAHDVLRGHGANAQSMASISV